MPQSPSPLGGGTAASGKAVELRITNLSGDLCRITADAAWTAQDAKSAIEAATGIPRRAQRLIAGTTQLNEGAALGQHLLPGADSTLELSLIRRSPDQVRWIADVTESWTKLLDAPHQIRGDREVVLAAVRQNGCVLRYAVNLDADREVVLAAVRQNGDALGYAAEVLREDPEIVLPAVHGSGRALGFASQALRADRSVVMAAVTQHGPALQFAAEALRADRGFILSIVERNGRALRYASEALRSDRQVVCIAIRQSSKAFLYASKKIKAELMEDDEMLDIISGTAADSD